MNRCRIFAAYELEYICCLWTAGEYLLPVNPSIFAAYEPLPDICCLRTRVYLLPKNSVIFSAYKALANRLRDIKSSKLIKKQAEILHFIHFDNKKIIQTPKNSNQRKQAEIFQEFRSKGSQGLKGLKGSQGSFGSKGSNRMEFAEFGLKINWSEFCRWNVTKMNENWVRKKFFIQFPAWVYIKINTKVISSDVGTRDLIIIIHE